VVTGPAKWLARAGATIFMKWSRSHVRRPEWGAPQIFGGRDDCPNAARLLILPNTVLLLVPKVLLTPSETALQADAVAVTQAGVCVEPILLYAGLAQAHGT
jgi:hypothetical protein